MCDSYANYKNVRNASWKVIIDFKVNKLPVNIARILIESNIKIIKNSHSNKLKNGESGISYFYEGQWYIIYDNTMQKERIRFTVAHELGHIFLGHELVGQHRRSFNTNKPQIETQADIFASRLLAPAGDLMPQRQKKL